MKLVRKSRLSFQEGKSDKVYEVDLCDVSTALSPNRFVVNFRYGRRGSALREGTKTATPVEREEADKLFDSVVVSKLNKGYREHGGSRGGDTTAVPARPRAPTSSRYEGALERVRSGLADIATDQLDERAACRILWRAGELGSPQFAQSLSKLLGQGTEMQDYCALWALGRCGDETMFDAAGQWIERGRSALVQRMALWASLRLGTEAQRTAALEPLKGRLPGSIYAVVDAEERLPLDAALDEYFAAGDAGCNDVLVNLYLLSYSRDNLREALLKVLAVVPLKPNYFRGIRQIYKAAEFFKDAAVFGLLNLRFDLGGAYCSAPRYGTHVAITSPRYEHVNYAKELKNSSSRLAYSDKTRTYLRHRTWRSLRRLGELGLDDYVEMAMGVLLAPRSEHKQRTRRSTFYAWDSAAQTSHEQVMSYDAYSSLICLNYILHRNANRYLMGGSRQAWRVNEDYVAGDEREEAFPQLWDRHPTALLRLLQDSELAPVHEFAARALGTQSDFCARIPVAVLVHLLQQSFACTVEFAFRIAQERYDPAAPDLELVLALLNSVHDEATAQAKSWVTENPTLFSGSVDFVLAVMTARTREIRHWGRLLLESAAQKNARELVQATLTWLLDQEAAGIDEERIADVEWALLEPLKSSSREVPFEQILALLAHAAPAIQALAGRLIIHHERPAQDVPASVFARLLESPVAEVRGVGVALFAQLPDAVIARQPELVEAFCLADEAQVRAGVRPAIARLAASEPEFARVLARSLIDRLFRRERTEGLHDDLVSLLTTELREHAALADKDLNWRLLQARSKAAQALGVWLLPQRDPPEFTVRQWAQLGRHADVAARAWAWACYRAAPERIAAEATDALRIVDSDWDDSRDFAFDYFRERFPPDRWTPELMIGICDSVRDDVQAFGRELITLFFADRDGAQYLLKLSQHPSANVQLFASNYLEGYAAGDIDRLHKLQPYFVTVLSQVNRNRITKDRVMGFLLREAAQSSQAAHLVARIFGRQSVTIAIQDKARYLAGMRDLALQYPEISMPVTLVPPPVYGPAAQPDDEVRA